MRTLGTSDKAQLGEKKDLKNKNIRRNRINLNIRLLIIKYQYFIYKFSVSFLRQIKIIIFVL